MHEDYNEKSSASMPEEFSQDWIIHKFCSDLRKYRNEIVHTGKLDGEGKEYICRALQTLNTLEPSGVNLSDSGKELLKELLGDEVLLKVYRSFLFHREIGRAEDFFNFDALESEAMQSERPPRIAQNLLSIFIPAEQREFVLGDLDEEYAIKLDANGSVKAKLWYYCNALSTIRLYLRQLKPVALLQKLLKRRL